MTDWPKCKWAGEEEPERLPVSGWRECNLGFLPPEDVRRGDCLACPHPADQQRAAELERVGRMLVIELIRARYFVPPCFTTDSEALAAARALGLDEPEEKT